MPSFRNVLVFEIVVSFSCLLPRSGWARITIASLTREPFECEQGGAAAPWSLRSRQVEETSLTASLSPSFPFTDISAMPQPLATLASSALHYGFHGDVAKIPGVNREKVCVDGVFGVWLQVYGDHYRENRHLVQVGGEAVPADVKLILRDLEFSFHCVVSSSNPVFQSLTRPLTAKCSSRYVFITAFKRGSLYLQRKQSSTCERFHQETSHSSC